MEGQLSLSLHSRFRCENNQNLNMLANQHTGGELHDMDFLLLVRSHSHGSEGTATSIDILTK